MDDRVKPGQLRALISVDGDPMVALPASQRTASAPSEPTNCMAAQPDAAMGRTAPTTG